MLAMATARESNSRNRPVTNHVKLASHSNEEWEAKRDIITRLYSFERRSIAEVGAHLQTLGFRVK
jgi:hypothetical protein